MMSNRFPVCIMLLPLLAGCIGKEYRELAVSPLSPPVEIGVTVAEGNPPRIVAGRKYRGTLETISREGKTCVVNRVSIEDYTKGAINGEISPMWPEESVKAMAIVIRSYAFQHWDSARGSARQLYSDVRSQEYCGINCEHERSNRAVDETSGLVLVYEGKPLEAFSHACCGGATEDSREVWTGEGCGAFRGRECTWCAGSKHWGPWVLVLEKTTLAKRLHKEIGADNTVESIKVAERNPSGRVRTIVVKSSGREIRMSGAHFRAIVGWNDLRSTRFDAADRGGAMEFRGVGWGHGVGLCQEGARKMAEEGKDCESILRHYFPGAEVWRITQ